MGLFSGSGVITGYNAENVNALRDIINNTAQQSASEIVNRLHDEIITPMSSIWYAPEAVTFFEGLAETVKASGHSITEAFDAFRAAVESAGINWAENTGGERPSLPPIDEVELNLNVSEIQSDNAGDVVINGEEATAIANKLVEVENGIKADLEKLAANLDAETAFIGNGQAGSIQQLFVTVSGEIHKIFEYLTEDAGDGESLQGQINKAVQKYRDVSTGISSAFDNVNQ